MPVAEISENVYMLNKAPHRGINDSNYFVVLGEKPVLIDCGSGEAHEFLERGLFELGCRIEDVECVIGTHCHYDHIAGISSMRQENPGLRLALHARDAEFVEEGRSEATCADWVFGTSAQPEKVDVKIEDDGPFSAGGLQFDIYHTPGHSPGSICIRFDTGDKKILFAGDCLVPGSHKVRSDFDEWKITLEKLLEIDFDIMIPGHPLQWAANPFYSSLMQPFSKPAGREVFRMLKDAIPRQFWGVSVFQYTHVMPVTTAIGRFFMPSGKRGKIK